MNRILKHIPEARGEEMIFLERLTEQCDEQQMHDFAMLYRSRRKDPQLVLILSVVGLVAIPGIQRFVLGQILMGVLYLFTAGFCLIGSIIDIVNASDMAFEYNCGVAYEIIEHV
ncbi:MAG: TM2 domain-containing protein [Bacteroidetes bacterium]|uniref:TM2 domain-containing protein n=1 Tax=Phaeocystidibacter marisrubri TaxID=1577780 RepID=A0A6L3ZGC6_9FLAO|nr:TM2 domain-containing protein [Phaeocystidibacter marisrubri]KAB2816467.1 TM2 domain-containing protein [Phaeocystidibacter marisrubri]TNE26730.1 MAG: TM2 domain-containing protein [Bacteroidota bacterium]GGH69201.1 membrane protein [Phaeocystidibacter marisrubri]